MKIVRILGGLGNQMFQYAFLVALREKFQQEILMDATLFGDYKLHQGFELTRIFNVTAREALPKEIKTVTRYTKSYFLHRVYKHLLPPAKNEYREGDGIVNNLFLTDASDKYYEGFWQNYRYFDRYKDSIMREFTLKEKLDSANADFIKEIDGTDAVSIHVRRGDYLTDPKFKGICELDYYVKAIDIMRHKMASPRFVVFSNDIEWCRENLLSYTGEKTTFVDWNSGKDSYKDMIVMSHCRGNIISNSSFSWWAAYMNRSLNQVVIAPRKWKNVEMHYQIQPDEWLLL